MVGRFEKFTRSFLGILTDWNKIASNELRKYGLKGPCVVYLLALYDNRNGITATNLCEICDKDKSEVSRAITTMEKKGVVSRVNTTVNGYRAKITLTELGVEITEKLRERVKLAVIKGGEGLTDEQREHFYSALETISKNTRKLSKEGL